MDHPFRAPLRGDRRLRVPARLTTLAAAAVALCLGPAAGMAGANGTAADASVKEHMQAHSVTAQAERAFARTREGRAAMRRARRLSRLDRVQAVRRPARAAVEGPADQVGQWGAQFNLPTPAIHSIVLVTGKVLFWSERSIAANQSWAFLYNPADGGLKRVDPPIDPRTGGPANIFCGGQSILADGRVLVTGGNAEYPNRTTGLDFKGLNHVYTFNPFDETWTRQPDMRHGRWYPTQVLLPSGETVVMGGTDETGRSTGASGTNTDVEVFTPSPDMNGVGTVRLVTPTNGVTPPKQGLYPHMFVMPSGRVLLAGPDKRTSWFMDGIVGGSQFGWTDTADQSRGRTWGTAVLMPGGQNASTTVMQISGADDNKLANAESQTYDETTGQWSAASPLNVGRGHHNTVLLPDGGMVTVGGGVGRRGAVNDFGPGEGGGQWASDPEHLQVELFDPASGAWRLGPSQREARAYHSTAVLLPDARVLSAGDNNPAVSKLTDTGEIYSPPYLFRGPRPTITNAPAATGYGGAFSVNTPDGNVVRAALVAPSSTTHAVDMNQRVLSLPTTRRADGSGVDVGAPSSPNAAPPGYYMLFLINDRGVPSVARFVRLLPGAPSQALAAVAPAPVPARPAAPQRAATTTAAARRAARRPTRVSTRRLLSRGLRVSVRCRRACRVTGELRVDRRTAKRLKLRRVVVGRSTRRLRRAGKVTFVVKPSSAARRSLRRARRSVTLTLRTTMDPTRGKTRRTGKQFVVVR